ncbi:MAG: hypothetical protein M5U23_12290 [Acidimicrobiia bacterium]|nr:hypothetical protein [Acidimicrobiia bacterium]
MNTILLVSDTKSVTDKVHASLGGADATVVDHTDPKTASQVAYEGGFDSVLVNMQVGTMGAMAVARAVRSGAGDDEPIPVTILLDRESDAFLAGRSGAKNWVSKDYTPAELREALGISQ